MAVLISAPAPKPANARGRLPKPLKMFLVLVFLLTIASALDAGFGFLHFGKSGLAYAWPSYPGFDFVVYTLRFPYLHTPTFFTLPVFPWFYPAPAILVLYPFYEIAAHTNRVFGFGVFGLTVVALDLLVMRRAGIALERHGLAPAASRFFVWSTLLLNWPIYFGLERGNLESLLWLGVAAGVFCCIQRRYVAGALILGVFGAVKLYPLLFLALLLPSRRFKELALGVITAVLTTVAALWVLDPDVGFAFRQVSAGVHRWTVIDVETTGALCFDHSIFGLLRQSALTDPARALHALTPYIVVAGLIATALFLGRVLRLPRPNQVLFLACAAVSLPPVSYDYTLAILLIPFGWLVSLCQQHARDGDDLRSWYPLFLLFAVAMAPLSFLHGHGATYFYFQGAVRAVCILGLMGFAVLIPVPEPAAESRQLNFA